MRKSTHNRLAVTALVGIAIFGGAATGIAVSRSAHNEGYNINSHGETFGSISGVPDPGQWPDLISVQLEDGSLGYVRSDDFAAATGWNVANPEEAARYMKERGSHGTGSLLTVYDKEGVAIGKWAGINWEMKTIGN